MRTKTSLATLSIFGIPGQINLLLVMIIVHFKQTTQGLVSTYPVGWGGDMYTTYTTGSFQIRKIPSQRVYRHLTYHICRNHQVGHLTRMS